MSRKVLLSANEAVAWAAFKAGCSVASAYPGTPSTEILENVAKFKDSIYCEWAVNEKVGMEVAIGASIAGKRALTAMKHVGLNVALDPLMTYTYVGANGGFVIIICDDPGIHSSQNEQDSRNLVKFARTPLFEPSDSQETFDMVLEAFEVSERFQVPVFVRLTTRTSHTSTVVDVGDDFGPTHIEGKGYVKDLKRYVAVPMNARVHKLKSKDRTEVLSKFASDHPQNRIEAGDKRIGIITGGITYQYVREVFPEFSTLKLGVSNPLPSELIQRFAASVERILVVEELDTFIEEQVKALGIAVMPHTTELNMMEMNPLRLMALRQELLGDIELPAVKRADAGLPTRPPVLCAGCSHRGVFYTLSKLGTTVMGDIGCYTLGAFPPLSAMDSTICMGAGIGNAHGMERAGYKGRICAVIGDSTFFHSGLTGILNVIYNGGVTTTIVLDNRITGMTGHQENPGSGKTLCGDDAPVTDIAEVAKAMGYKRVVTVAAYDLPELERVLKEELDAPEPSVVIAGAPCRIAAKLWNAATYGVDAEKCKACGACFKLGCPAITRGETSADGKRFKCYIDPVQCSGCNLCIQTCKFGAISKIR